MDQNYPLAAWERKLSDGAFRLLVTGLPGGGKTSVLKRLYVSLALSGVVEYLTDNADELVVLMTDKLKGSGVPVRSISMKYADGVGLRLGKLLATEAGRIRFCWKMIPNVKGDTAPFWANSARVILLRLTTALFKLSKGKLFLADIIRVAEIQELTSIVCVQAEMRDPYRSHGDNNSKRDVHTTLVSNLIHLSLFAAVDLRIDEKQRIDLPLKNGVLVLEMPDTFAKALSGLYPFLLDTIGDDYLSRQSTKPVLYGIDEYPDYEPIDCIARIARRGRKSGISLALSHQELSFVHDRYSRDVAEGILGLMTDKIFFAQGSATSAEWASAALGETESLQQLAPMSTDGSNKTISTSVVMRRNCLPNELQNLEMPDFDKDELTGWAVLSATRKTKRIVSKFTCKFRDAVVLNGPPIDRPLRSPTAQEMPKLQQDDLPRLGIKKTDEITELLK